MDVGECCPALASSREKGSSPYPYLDRFIATDWIPRCIREGRLLPDAPFRIVRSQKLRVDDFFSPCKKERGEFDGSKSLGDSVGANGKHTDGHRRLGKSVGSHIEEENRGAHTRTSSGTVSGESTRKGGVENTSSPRRKRDRDGRVTGVKCDEADRGAGCSKSPVVLSPRSAHEVGQRAKLGAGPNAEERSSLDPWESRKDEKRRRYPSSPLRTLSVAIDR